MVEEFDVTQPFLLTKHSSRRGALQPPTTPQGKPDMVFTTIARRVSTRFLSTCSGCTPRLAKFVNELTPSDRPSLEAFTAKLIRAEEHNNSSGAQKESFYLNYLEFFVKLLIKFYALANHSHEARQSPECQRYELLGKKILTIARELLAKHVNDDNQAENRGSHLNRSKSSGRCRWTRANRLCCCC